MINKIFGAIDKFGMLSYGDRVVVGLSGGADSITLLHFLSSIREELKLDIVAAHVNHCLRGEDSENDESFAREFCKRISVPIEILKVDVSKASMGSGCGIEECGRNIRYDFFNKLALENDAKIATAHTLSDSIETMLLNFTRGAGLGGMCGIPAIRGRVIRPLIYCTREDIENYCRRNSLEFVTDKSNFSRVPSRNKIRLDVIPVLKEINSSLEKTVLRMAEQFRDDNDYLNEIAGGHVAKSKNGNRYKLEMLASLNKSILSRCIRKIIFDECGVKVENIHIDLIIEKIRAGFGAVTVPSNVNVNINNGFLYVESGPYENINNRLWEFNINHTKILTESKREFIIKIIGKNEYDTLVESFTDEGEYLLKNAIAYENINSNTLIRNRRSCDKFKQLGRGVTKTLKKLFNEAKIPLNERNNISLIANNNEVLWIEGFGISESAKVKHGTKKVLVVFKKECDYDK